MLEGIDNCTHHGTPITFIGAGIWCPACHSRGVIGAKGPHRNATMTGRQQALDGDICLCRCSPPPLCLASQDSAWHEFGLDETVNSGADGKSGSHAVNAVYNEQFRLIDDNGVVLRNVRYRVYAGVNIVAVGTTDANGRTQRIATEGRRDLRLDVLLQK
ncbi:PAAR domain-containing protein [Paraburkholderia acidisoli]|uniref:PAAR motif-containing protein n=1 Tax=Paraburkholderia acidisoli TaxID=2571748 RepID=A0A7Z2GG69_9BURK|nr:PAAR domain-containing protein [Paraburkholderia acidisoli]QGZ61216.1 hypothetical protein FAZ98_05430 [Paraburkholderia acidisoli]